MARFLRSALDCLWTINHGAFIYPLYCEASRRIPRVSPRKRGLDSRVLDSRRDNSRLIEWPRLAVRVTTYSRRASLANRQ